MKTIRSIIVKRIIPLALVIAALLLAGCPKPTPGPTRPEPSFDIALMSSACADACAAGLRLGCDFARNTPAGVPCVTVCEETNASGLVTWDTRCIETAVTCQLADACLVEAK